MYACVHGANAHQIQLIIESFFINEMKMKGTEINIYENITFSALNRIRIGKKYVWCLCFVTTTTTLGIEYTLVVHRAV